jgi:hypothetical protein
MTAIEVIDKYIKYCLYRGNDINAKGYNLAAWDIVTMPKDKVDLVSETFIYIMMLFY